MQIKTEPLLLTTMVLMNVSEKLMQRVTRSQWEEGLGYKYIDSGELKTTKLEIAVTGDGRL